MASDIRRAEVRDGVLTIILKRECEYPEAPSVKFVMGKISIATVAADIYYTGGLD